MLPRSALKCRDWKGIFCFVQEDPTYQPQHKRHSLPPYCPYLATFNFSPNNKVNAKYNGQCSEKELFTTLSRQM
jgi:hypothetical protein